MITISKSLVESLPLNIFRKDLAGQTVLKQLVPAAVLGALTGCFLLLGTPEKLFDWMAPSLVLVATGARLQVLARLLELLRSLANCENIGGKIVCTR